MQPKTERFEMRLDQDTFDRVDAWRGKQDDVPSRAEAVRRLIEVGLATTTGTSIAMSDGEKLILGMLCDMYKGLKVKGEFDPDFIQSAIYGGHYWGLKWELQGIYHGHSDDEKKVSEVVDILDMWSFMEEAHDKMSQKDKDHLKANGEHVKFLGFDGNNESEHLGIARFLIEKMDRFTRFKGQSLNSHCPSIDGYRRMLSVFIPMRAKLVGRGLSATEIVELFEARVHPSDRKQKAS